jgi:hypothetical protein
MSCLYSLKLSTQICYNRVSSRLRGHTISRSQDHLLIGSLYTLLKTAGASSTLGATNESSAVGRIVGMAFSLAYKPPGDAYSVHICLCLSQITVRPPDHITIELLKVILNRGSSQEDALPRSQGIQSIDCLVPSQRLEPGHEIRVPRGLRSRHDEKT